jgi:hypothetical protein
MLMQVIKQLPERMLGRACLTYQELAAHLCGCEVVLYARPLTYVFSDESDMKPLTPSFILPDVHKVAVPDGDFSDAESLKRRLRFLQNLLQDLRKRFHRDMSGRIEETHGAVSKRGRWGKLSL